MSNQDGTGPKGQGAMTGRGQENCQRNNEDTGCRKTRRRCGQGGGHGRGHGTSGRGGGRRFMNPRAGSEHALEEH